MISAFGVQHEIEKKLPMPPKGINRVMMHPAFQGVQHSLSHATTGQLDDMAIGAANALRPHAVKAVKSGANKLKQKGILKPIKPRLGTA